MSRILTTGTLLTLITACGQVRAPSEPHEPCSGGPNMEVLPRPTAFEVSMDAGVLGTLLVPESGPVIFTPDAAAPAEWVAAFEADLATYATDPFVLGWTIHTLDGGIRATLGCDRPIAQNDPEYPGAIRQRATHPLQRKEMQLRLLDSIPPEGSKP